MLDSTAHAEHGQLLEGEVYDVPDEYAEHLKNIGLAKMAHGDTETYRERQAREANETPAEPAERSVTNPDIARQVREAGTREGDKENASFPTRQPINKPPTAPRGQR
jgi:hypothetical protein